MNRKNKDRISGHFYLKNRRKCENKKILSNFSCNSNTKAQMSWVVGIIVLLIAFFVVFGIIGKIVDIMKGAGSDAACTASAQVSSKTKIAGVEAFSLKCPMNFLTITMDDLRAETTKSKKELGNIDVFNSQNNDAIDLERFAKTGQTRDFGQLKEYALDKRIAEEMRSCWQKLGEGELDLFNAWYGNQKDRSWRAWIPGLGEDEVPVTCVICSRIKFDKEIKEEYPEIKSLNEWLKMSTVPKRDITYYDFLIDEQHDEFLFTMDWEFSTAEPVAIVFARMNPRYPLQAAGNLLNFIGLIEKIESVDALYLMPYAHVGQNCDYLANEPPEE